MNAKQHLFSYIAALQVSKTGKLAKHTTYMLSQLDEKTCQPTDSTETVLCDSLNEVMGWPKMIMHRFSRMGAGKRR